MATFQLLANQQRLQENFSRIGTKELVTTPYNVTYRATGVAIAPAPNITLAQNDVLILDLVDVTSKQASPTSAYIAGAFNSFAATYSNIAGSLQIGFYIFSKVAQPATPPNLTAPNPVVIDTTVAAISLAVPLTTASTDSASITNSAPLVNTATFNVCFVDMLSAALTANSFNPLTQVVGLCVTNISATNSAVISLANNSRITLTGALCYYSVDNTQVDSFNNQDGINGVGVN